eukprot:6204113-Pleurochrysis_carterae.AAC.4
MAVRAREAPGACSSRPSALLSRVVAGIADETYWATISTVHQVRAAGTRLGARRHVRGNGMRGLAAARSSPASPGLLLSSPHKGDWQAVDD